MPTIEIITWTIEYQTKYHIRREPLDS